ncbi:hypothetical protein MMYC01_204872 [Madurella mycetomatis]|uniref:Uncharacterized protein n=1 Tax=Madurella mycetomatis TaxID=100816 RepID=A0A175W1U2_9PEZI|nr:hypothetical protein MMYC01_204872 [Madurella mycetomatis]
MGFKDRFFPRQFRYNSLDINSEKSSISDGEADPLRGRLPLSPVQRSSRSRHYCLLLATSVLALALAVALTVVTTMHLRLVRETAPRKEVNCGNSMEEALENGCSFDELSKAWLPPACPRYGTNEFLESAAELNNGSWQYWTGPDGAVELTYEEMSKRIENNPGERWSWAGTDREHMAHCAWLIIRLAHAYDTGARVDMLTANFQHTKHCTLMMLERAMSAPYLDEKITRGDVVFGYC